MLEKEKKFLDQTGLEYLWSKINMQDYPNNDTLIAVINAIDEGKMDKTTAIPLIEQAVAGQVPVVKSIDENGKPVEWEAKEFTPEFSFKIISYPDYGILASEKTFKEVDNFAFKHGLNNLNLSLFIAGTTLYNEEEGRNPYYYVTSCDKIYGITEEETIAYDFTFIVDQEKRVYRLNENGVSLISVTKNIPETTEPNQYLTTNENGEKVWEDKIDITPLQSAIDTLNGTGEGSVRDTVADAVATIVANAPEDFDTLKEIADWISNDTLGTADLLQRMTTAEEKIVALDVQADWNQTDESAKDFILNKPVPITDDEIDAICGSELTLDVSDKVLVDTVTDIVYKVYVENGKLSMKQVNGSSDTTELVFVDTSTDIVYKVYVENGKLHMMEVE